MADSGDNRKRPDSQASGPEGLAVVLMLVKKWITTLAGIVTLLAAIGAFVQPYAHSGVALIGASLTALAALTLLAVGIAVAYTYRNTRFPGWVVLLVVAMVLAAGTGIGIVVSKRAPDTGPVAQQSTSPSASNPASVAPSTGACPPDPIAEAISGLASSDTNTRIGAIRALKQDMSTSPAEQCAVIKTLSDFIRSSSPILPSGSDGPVTAEVQAALSALAGRDPSHDGGAVIDLHNTNLTNADLAGADLAGADLSGDNGADLTDADLANANLSRADLANAYLGGASLSNANLTGANLQDASLFQTPLCSATNTPVHPDEGYNCNQ